MLVDLRSMLLVFSFFLLAIFIVEGQEQFKIDETGLSPKFIVDKDILRSQDRLYPMTLRWIEENKDTYNIALGETFEGKTINFTFKKGNAVNLDKQYYTARYHIAIDFENENIVFKPEKIELKLNSKYDMGWKNFDLENGVIYYRKGKIIKKYKRYLRDLVSGLNELNRQLSSYIKSD